MFPFSFVVECYTQTHDYIISCPSVQKGRETKYVTLYHHMTVGEIYLETPSSFLR